MKGYLHQTPKKPGKNNVNNLTFLKNGIFLISMTLILTSLASAQVEFRDEDGFDFYNQLDLYSDLSVEDGNISMNDNRILGLPEPSSSGEPLTQGSGSGDYVDRTGDSMSGDLDLQDNFLLGDNGEIDFSSGEMILDQQMPNSGSPTTLQINQDGTPKWALVSMQDGGLGIYDAEAGEIVQEFNENGQIEFQNRNLSVNSGQLSFGDRGVVPQIRSHGTDDLQLGGGRDIELELDTDNDGGTRELRVTDGAGNTYFDVGEDGSADINGNDLEGVDYILGENEVNLGSDLNTRGNSIKIRNGDSLEFIDGDSNELISLDSAGTLNSNSTINLEQDNDLSFDNSYSLAYDSSNDNVVFEDSNGNSLFKLNDNRISSSSVDFDLNGQSLTRAGTISPEGSSLEFTGNIDFSDDYSLKRLRNLSLGRSDTKITYFGSAPYNEEYEVPQNSIRTEGIVMGDTMPPNLIRNSKMSYVDQNDVPLGYDVYDDSDSSIDIKAVHPYTKGYEGPYTDNLRDDYLDCSTEEAAVANVSRANQSNPCWFGDNDMGLRSGRSGLASGWSRGQFGRILRMNGTVDESNTWNAVTMPYENEASFRELLFQAWIYLEDGQRVCFGHDGGYNDDYCSGKTIVDQEDFESTTDGWYRVNEIIPTSQVSSVDGKLQFGFEGSGEDDSFEVYLALPYLANINDEAHWNPSATDMVGRQGVYINPENGEVNITRNDMYLEENDVYDVGTLNASTINANTKNFVQEINETHEAVYTSQESPRSRAVIEGGSKLNEGEKLIEFPLHFSKVISKSEPDYNVQLTPKSAETYGLAYTMINNTHFKVEELADKKNNIEFDYRITAVREGHENKKVVREK